MSSKGILLSLGLLAVGFLLTGCGGGDGATDRPVLLPSGEVVASEALVAAPGRNFLVSADGASWEFRLWAMVSCRVLRPVAHSVEFFFQPGAEEADLWFRLFWDGREVGGGGGGHEVRGRIPPDLLTSGDHSLKVQRLYADRPVAEVRLERFGYRLGAEERLFLPAAEGRLRHLDAFLSVGVTGIDRQKYGGVLFDGPGSKSWPLSAAKPGKVEARIQNLSAQALRFTARLAGEVEDIEVPAGETRTQRFPVSAGEHTLELAATGSAEGVFLWGQPQWIGKARASVPPIVLITMDTTRRDALGPYGGPSGLTPRIDAFARGATVFERAWSTSPWTLPSHASIMTGLYPSRHRAGVDQQHLASEHPTLARLLGEAGYLTAGFAGGALCSHRYGVAQGFGRYLDPETFESSGAELNAAVGELLGEVHHQPLFLFVNFFDPHALYHAPEEFQERAGVEGKRAALAEDPLWQAFDRGDSVAWRRIIDGEGRVTPEILGYVRAAYRSEVAYMDEQIGLLFRQLEEKDLFDRALIILVADHGELLGEYGGLFSHAGRLDPELTEIPMIVKWPGQREGRREDRLVSQVDLFATVLEAAGLEVPSSDGRSLAPREETGAPRILFLEEHESRVHPLPPRLRLAPHVFGVQRPNARLEVWDGGMACARRTSEGWMEEACSSSPQVVLERVEQSLGAAPAVQGAGEVDPEAREALKALGYL